MKETKPVVEIARKHREDVIDTLQLRHKERRVLYTLLLILLLTLAYENSAFLYDRLIGAAHPLPELGQRKKAQLKQDMIKPLEKALVDASEDYPQYWARFSQNQKRLTDAAAMLVEDGMVEDALELVKLVVASMNEFSAHPVIKATKKLERLNTEMATIQRILKFKVDLEGVAPKPLVFARDASVADDQSRRNLFEYSLR